MRVVLWECGSGGGLRVGVGGVEVEEWGCVGIGAWGGEFGGYWGGVCGGEVCGGGEWRLGWGVES